MDSPMDKIHAGVEAVQSQSLTSLLLRSSQRVFDRAVFGVGRASAASAAAAGLPSAAPVSRLDPTDNTCCEERSSLWPPDPQ